MNFRRKMTVGSLSLILLLGFGAAAPGFAQLNEVPVPCSFTRDDVLAALANGATEEEAAAQFANCEAVDVTSAPANSASEGVQSLAAGLNTITNTGITFWEAIEACGYHPQREELNCSIDIRQRFGFGGFPHVAPGTHEWVLFCVSFGGGFVPINTSALHVHDEQFGSPPPWSQGVVVQANTRLHSLPNNGQTLRGRAILSWLFVPTGCGFIPPFGNQADFRFKLDP